MRRRTPRKFLFVVGLAWLAFLVLVLAGEARAQAVDAPSIAYNTAGGTVTGGSITRVNPDFQRLMTQEAGGAVKFKDTYPVRVGKTVTPMELTRAVPWSGVARAVGRAMPLAAGGMLIYDLYSLLRCRNTASGSAECDDGTEPSPREVVVYCNEGTCGNPGTATYSSAPEAFNALSRATRLCMTSSVCYDEPTRNAVATSADPAPTSTNSGGVQVHGTYTYPGGSFQFSSSVFFLRRIEQRCPAVPGNESPHPNIDGKCPTGQYVPKTEDQLGQKVEDHADKSKAVDMAREAMNKGVDFQGYVNPQPGTIGGPATAAGPTSTTTTTNPGGGTTTQTKGDQYNITYTANSYTYNTTTITNNPDGSTTEESNPDEKVETCGLPGKPACKIDETGTPDTVPGAADPDTVGRELEDRDRQGLEADVGAAAGPSFGFIDAPPLVACTGFELPRGMGTIDPCGVVDSVRLVMAFLWALAGAWLCLSMVRKL